MLLRIRWFVLGIASSLGVAAYLAAQVKRARERLSAKAIARSGGRTVASLLDRAAARVSPESGDVG
jgi:hypothetical protein